MVDKVKQQKVIIITKELLTGQELIEVIKENKLENHLIERVEKRAIYDEKTEYRERLGIIKMPKIIDSEYIYIFIDREVKNG